MPNHELSDDPLWYKDAVIYEVHVRAFLDSNGDGVGDFPGLTSKIGYLRDLGVTCLWLLPFYPSPLKDDGYDIAHYEGVHPSYGTLKDFKAFLREAHEAGLRVVTELVINHTSDQHAWFQAARRAPAGSPKRDYYVWSDTNRKYEGARIIFTDSETSNWTWDPVAQSYYWHRFFHHQPDLNFDNPRVERAVLKVMNFWLDMGVDGLRLDAIPYLCEREGTNCENLPETHAVLKRIRAEVEARYRSRMLLAEANQWPADVRAYFGEGDECHMAFNFPLMPRIFMALRQEDRYPIVEILRQTPDIPDACQWAIFLRNHDELTLEMVTDEERDYMYRAYAADPQMRINIGIRRRLAPLMENSRRRVELAYSLLFSLPGTPVLYYGDEIGMGDNIYLGDRNGVRTPMQWTSDRNAGFSKADPARLFAPPIMDPVYGYQGLNVEAQERSPFSLLNWVKRMIGLRRQHAVFGRGTIEFLPANNRRVLVYVRRLGDDVVLCVANLARSVQPVEIDLSRFAGLVPVEMRDRADFPRIGTAPYFLSLGPYGFYWFRLQHEPEPAATLRAPAAPIEMTIDTRPALFAGPAWETLLDGNVRRLIERDYLLAFLERQRWFGGKARRPTAARISDWGLLSRGDEPTFLWLVDVSYADGSSDRYFMPVASRSGAAAAEIERSAPSCVIARLSGARKGVLHDMCDDRVAAVLLDAIEAGRHIATRHGEVRATATSVFAAARGPSPAGALRARRIGGEQSNTSLLFDDRLMLKLIRRVEPGLNPDYEIGLHLTERSPFARAPRLAGALEYTSGPDRSTVGVLHAFVEHQANAWEYSLDQARQFLDRALARPDSSPDALTATASLVALSRGELPALVRETVAGYLDTAAVLGRRTAELHLALAHAAGDPAFEPEPMTRADAAAIAAGMREHAAHATATLGASMARVPERLAGRARAIVESPEALLARFAQLANLDPACTRIRVHGDYHLGQVLYDKGDFIVVDFEGEPLRPIDERRRKQPALKDVAGMLRSFSYASYAALFAYAADRPADFDRLEPWTRLWQAWASSSFLRAYLAAARGASFVPHDAATLDAMLSAYLLDKAFYELVYELNNRPDWLAIPVWGLLGLV